MPSAETDRVGPIFAIPILIAAQLPANRHSPCGKHGELGANRIVDIISSDQPAPTLGEVLSARSRVPPNGLASLPIFSSSN